MSKILRRTEKLLEARRMREEWLVKKEREKKEKKRAKSVSPVPTLSSSAISPKGQNGGVSTDEDEIDEKIHILLKRLEAKLENPKKTSDEKRRTKSKVNN